MSSFFPSNPFILYLPLTLSSSFQYPPPPFSSHLAQNPFICDCNLKWLADYLRSNPIETSGARCASPRRLANKRIGQIKSKKFRCSGRPEAKPLTISKLLRFFLSGPLYLSDRVCLYSTCLSLLYSSSFSLLGVAFISALFPLTHTTFNEGSFPAKGFIWPIICCATSPASQSISPRIGGKQRGIIRSLSLSLSPLPHHITTLWVWFHTQTTVGWDHSSRLV